MTANTDSNCPTIQDLIRRDHENIDRLFLELETFNEPKTLQGRFTQLYKELTVHAEAKEETVYPAVRPYYGDDNVQQRHDEHAEINVLLYEMRILSPTSPEFKEKLQNLKQLVKDHFHYEENTMFAAMSNHLGSDEANQLSIKFRQIKALLSDEVEATMKADPIEQHQIF